MNNVAVIFPSRTLLCDALKESKRMGLVLQTNFARTIAAPKKLPGFTVMGARSRKP